MLKSSHSSTQYFVVGNNSLNKMSSILREKSVKKVALFCGKESFLKSELYLNEFKKLFSFLEVFVYNDCPPNPTLQNLEMGVAFLKKMKVEQILCIGGGSVLDLAKMSNAFFAQQFSPIDYFKAPSEFTLKKENLLPLWAIPSTSGTGSESTQFATIYIDGIKNSLDHPFILPEKVFLDSRFSLHLPRSVTVETAADALCQAIESYWSNASTEVSRQYSKLAIELLHSNIFDCLEYPNLTNRQNLSLGANLAGRAIQLTRTTAPHAISYPITSFYNIPHGQAVALTLPSVFAFNSKVTKENCLHPQGPTFVLERLEELSHFFDSTLETMPRDLTQFFKKMGLKMSFSDLTITNPNFAYLIEHGFTPSRVKNNPRAINADELKELLFKLR